MAIYSNYFDKKSVKSIRFSCTQVKAFTPFCLRNLLSRLLTSQGSVGQPFFNVCNQGIFGLALFAAFTTSAKLNVYEAIINIMSS